ncbi:MAG: hypothetical protein NTU95_10295 [Methanothrix sp.]|nr:hypothetical protein [Methanothrix sp.]
MASGMFLIQNDGSLIEMEERAYTSEDHLQELLATYPNLLAGNQIDEANPRRWLLISREVGLPAEENSFDRWSVDHLFLDQDAIPTLVEVKRSSDTRIRREVLGQMLDYAANAVVYWPVEAIQAKFEATCAAQNIVPEEKLEKFLYASGSPDDFWQKVQTNLHDGRIRMLFVADEIPAELRRIVEFLNTQMDPAEVLAIEIKQYVGTNVKTLVPRVFGQIATPPPPRPRKMWDKPSFLISLTENIGPKGAEVANQILNWAETKMLKIDWGKGSTKGMFQPLVEYEGHIHHTISIWTYGKIQIEFVYMEPPFDTEDKRHELIDHLNKIQGVSIPLNKTTGEPSIPIELFYDENKLKQFIATLDWVVEEIKSTREIDTIYPKGST